MALLFLCLVLQLVFLCPSINAAENDSCISNNYEELKKALYDNETNNIPMLLNAFYPPNSQEVQVARVKYCISDNKTFCSDEQFDEEHINITYKWAASALLLVQEYELIDALVFDLFKFNYTNITLIISPPFCDDVSQDEIIDNLRHLTARLKLYAQSDGSNINSLLKGFAVHLDDEDKEKSFDITVYDRVEKLHYSLLVLQFVSVIIIILTLLFRILSPSFANEIDMKMNKVSKSFSRISNFIKGIKKDMYQNNSKTSQKKSWEYTMPYLILLIAFFVWDSVQYHKAEKISKYEWIFFFPIPYVAPTFIITSMSISILLFFWYYKLCFTCSWYCIQKVLVIWYRGKHLKYTRKYTSKVHCCYHHKKYEEIPESFLLHDIAGDIEKSAVIPKAKQMYEFSCTCQIRDIVHFPILTGLGVFFVYHGSWMLLIFSAYANIVIIKSLFLLPLFCFIMALLPRMIKGSSNLFINWCYQSEVFTKCMKCMKCKKSSTKCKKCKKCKECTICTIHKEDNCKDCIKCDTCKQHKNCKKDPKDKCDKCNKCSCDQCQRCKHCKQCTLCNDCKNCEGCKQCFSCKLRNRFKLCMDCMKEKQRHKKNTIAIYGFSVTLAITIPLLFVLYYGSDYILFVTDIHDDPFKLLIALVVILGVPYYLIIIWDNDISGNKNALINHQPPTNNEENQPPTNQPLPNTGEHQPPTSQLSPPNNGEHQPPTNQPPTNNEENQPPTNNGEHQPPTSQLSPPNNGEHQPPTNQPPTNNEENQPPTNNEENQPPTNNGEHQPPTSQPPQDALADVTHTRKRSETV